MATGRIIRPRTQEGWDLLVPDRKPFGRLEINSDNKFGKHCVFAYAPTSSSGIFFASVSKQLMQSQISGIVTEKNNNVYFNDTYVVCPFPDRSFAQFTAISRFFKPNGIDGIIATGHGAASAESGFQFVTWNGGLACYINSSRPYVGTTLNDGFHTAAVTYIENVHCSIFKDGVRLLRDAANIPAGGMAISTTGEIAVGLMNTGNRLTGEMEYSFLFDIAFSDNEVAELSRNPYQIFRSANDTPFLYAIPSSATVTLSSPTATATGPTTANVGCTVTYT